MELKKSMCELTPVRTPELNETKDYREMRFLLEVRHEDEFIERFRACEEHDFQNVDFNIDDKTISDLLTSCMFNRAPKAFNVLLNSRYIGQEFNGEELIHFAAFHNYNVPLGALLSHPTLQYRRRAILRDCMSGIYSEETLKVIIESTGVDVNACCEDGKSLLAFAVMFREWNNVAFLLRNGAYLTSLLTIDEVEWIKLITEIPAGVLEDHFDHCIRKVDCPIPNIKQDVAISMAFSSLILQANATTDRECTLDSDDGQQENGLVPQPTQVPDELAVIASLAKSKDHRYLLQHPLIESFIGLKWRVVSRVFYVNFISHLVFAVTIVGFILLKYEDANNQVAADIFHISAWIGLAYVIVREIVQCILFPRVYVRAPINYIEIALIVLSIMALLSECARVVDACTILLVGFESCLLMGSVPAIATHMQMLRQVSKTFLRFSILYSALILTFSLCFYVLFGGSSASESDQNRFSNPILAFLWTIVMLTGDFDTGNMHFVSPYSYVIFILFVVFMAIVLINLLNGLAVSDTQAIKNESYVYALISQCSILCHYEKMRSHSKIVNRIVNHKFVRMVFGVTNEKTPHEIIAPVNNGVFPRICVNMITANRNEIQKGIILPNRIVKPALDVIEKKRFIQTRNQLLEMENKLKKIDEKIGEKLNDIQCTLQDLLAKN